MNQAQIADTRVAARRVVEMLRHLTEVGKTNVPLRRSVFVAVGVGVLLLPVVIGNNDYLMHIAIMTMLWGYLALAWNVLFGQAGQLSFGHGMFYGLGAYGAAFMLQRFDLPPLVGAPVGVLLATAVAALVGFFTFRYGLRGLHFALFTFFGAELLRMLALNATAEGPSGMIMRLHRNSAVYLQFDSRWPYYYLAAALVAVGIAVGYATARSRVGYYWRAIREDEEAAEALGINAFRYKMYAIVTSGALTGLGGVFAWQYHGFVDPGSAFGMDVTLEMVVRGVIGGIGSIVGPVLVSVVITPATEVLSTVFGTQVGLHVILFGVLVTLMGFWMVRRERRARERQADARPAGLTDAVGAEMPRG